MSDEEEKHGGWIDRAFGLDPTKSFTESWNEKLYGPGSLADTKEDDSTVTKLGRAGYSALVSPLSLAATVWGDVLDTAQYGPWGIGEEHVKAEGNQPIGEQILTGTKAIQAQQSGGGTAAPAPSAVPKLPWSMDF